MANPNLTYPEFFFAVKRAAETRDPDRRLFLAAAPSTQSQEENGADGGYLVPPDIRAGVVDAVLGETSLLARTDRITTRSNSVTLPTDASPAWASMAPTLESAGAVLGQVKLALQGRTVRLQKIQATVPVTSELFEDAPGLAAYLRAAVPQRLDWAVTNFLLNGDGVNKPLGVLNSPALITQTKEGAQPAGTIVYANVSKMWGRLWSPAKSRAVWLASPTAETQLQQMVAPVGSPAFVYPPDAPCGYLFGRPVLVTEAAQVVGTPGDVALVDPLAILTATREGVVKEDLSLHVWFDMDLAAFRFTMRLAAAPWWASAVTPYRGSTTVSSAVVIEAR